MVHPEIGLPIWLLQDESISPEMLAVYAKLKAKIPLRGLELEIRTRLVAKGLVRTPADDERNMGSDSGLEKSHNALTSETLRENLSPGSEFLSSGIARSDDDCSVSVKRKGKENQKRKGKKPIKNYQKDYITNQTIEVGTEPMRSSNETAREEEDNGREFNALEGAQRKIRRFKESDPRPYAVKMKEFWKECHRVHREACVQRIRDYLREQLKKRAEQTGIEIEFDYEEWRTVQLGHAQALHTQYCQWQPQDWVEAIDFFLGDSFWSNVIIDVKTLRRNINRYVVWRQKKEPNKIKFAVVKVIGRR